MAAYATNDWYFDIDGTNLSAYLVSVNPSFTQATVETTAGSSTDHVTRSPGLEDASISFDIRADSAAGYSLALLKGSHTITYGQQGSAVGKPKHVLPVILTGISHTTQVSKEMVVYTVNGDAASAPTTDMYAGGVWA